MAEFGADQIRAALTALAEGISHLGAKARPVMAFEFAQELVAATLRTATAGLKDADVTDIVVRLEAGTITITAQVHIKGKAWPPRLPMNTRVSLGLRELACDESGKVTCRVEEPLEFSSAFAEVMAGLVGKFAKHLPVPLDDLRKKDSAVVIDPAELVKALRPGWAWLPVRLYGLKAVPGHLRVEIGLT